MHNLSHTLVQNVTFLKGSLVTCFICSFIIIIIEFIYALENIRSFFRDLKQ